MIEFDKNTAVVFPGQGSQFVGMGKDLLEKSKSAKDVAKRMSKDDVTANYKYVGDNYNQYLEHLNIQTVAPTPDMIQKTIRDLQPNLVVVDYIDLIEPPRGIRGEYEQVRYVSHFLSNLAVNLDINSISQKFP